MHEIERSRISDPGAAGAVTEVRSALSPDEVCRVLAQAGRRGRLPGFAAVGSRGFRIDCDAVPFEHGVIGEVRDAGDGVGGSVVTLRTERRRLLPWIFGVTLALTVWPGVWLTDSVMGVYWSAYGVWSDQMPWLTYAWYLPVTALPLPWLWRSLTRKSAAMAAESGAKVTETIRSLVGKAS